MKHSGTITDRNTDPRLTASPIAYQLVNAAEQALLKMR
jgi:hypothetical protein